MPAAKKSTKTEEVIATATPAAPAAKAPSTKGKQAEKAAAAPAAKAPSTKTDKAASTKSASTKSDKAASTKAAPAKAPKAPKEPKQPKEAAEPAEPVEKTPRRPPTKDTINEDFSGLETRITTIIDDLRKSGQKNVGIANWKSILKTVKQLHTDANRVNKLRKATKTTNNNGGFHKPVDISKELSKFCASHAAEVAKACKVLADSGAIESAKYTEWKPSDWKENEKATRSRVTKFLCDYVKAKNLQKPDNKREFKVDDDMKALFNLKNNDKDNEGRPIDYCSLQRLVKPHYIVA